MEWQLASWHSALNSVVRTNGLQRWGEEVVRWKFLGQDRFYVQVMLNKWETKEFTWIKSWKNKTKSIWAAIIVIDYTLFKYTRWIKKSVTSWTKHEYIAKKSYLFLNVVSFDLHRVRPTFWPLSKDKICRSPQIGVCLSDDILVWANFFFPSNCLFKFGNME